MPTQVKRIKELEKGRKPLQEKNRKFLEKNMSLTVIKRNLEEKLEKLSEETAKLVSDWLILFHYHNSENSEDNSLYFTVKQCYFLCFLNVFKFTTTLELFPSIR